MGIEGVPTSAEGATYFPGPLLLLWLQLPLLQTELIRFGCHPFGPLLDDCDSMRSRDLKPFQVWLQAPYAMYPDISMTQFRVT